MILKSLLSFVLLFFIAFEVPAFATVHLSVTPSDGSNSLRLSSTSEGLDSKKEIHVRITTTGGKQYQVFQRVLEPIVNEKGQTLDLQAIETATYANSNSSGTLYMQNIDRMSFSDQLIYTSGRSGDSDSFVVGYSLRPDLVNTSGNFMGKVAFTVRAIGDNSQDQVIVNTFVESPSNWKVSVQGGHAPDLVKVKDTDAADKHFDFVRISFEGNSSQEIRIYQDIESWPRNSNGDEIKPGVLQFYTAGESSKNLRTANAVDLGKAQELLYSGRESKDGVMVYFLMDPLKLQTQDSGTYNGRLKYTVETDKGRQDFSINLECQVQPVFTLDVDVPPEGVSFSNVLATNPPEDKEISVTVRSNLHKPYQVMQNLQAPMTNEKGQEIKKEYFTIKVEIPAGQKGQTKFTDFSPTETGDYPVFSSDGQGSPVSFKVIYRLQGYPQMSGGHFLAPIKYSLDQN
ncbi:MAG: hypothetical protein HQL16_04035 [Candidatus Omnitrophica bacterium]|nr:hypothetical protein [Candidatus Omnitrophota bacterium]